MFRSRFMQENMPLIFVCCFWLEGLVDISKRDSSATTTSVLPSFQKKKYVDVWSKAAIGVMFKDCKNVSVAELSLLLWIDW